MKIIDKQSEICENIKSLIITSIQSDEVMTRNFSVYLSEKFEVKYSYLTKLFTNEFGFSIRDFIVNTRVERVKKLIDENELNINEIGYKMHYSSTSHLSHQFKSVTNNKPLEYKYRNTILRSDNFIFKVLI